VHPEAFARSMVWRPLAPAVLGFLLNACGPAGSGAAADADANTNIAGRLLGLLDDLGGSGVHRPLPAERHAGRSLHAIAFPCCHRRQPMWRAR